MERETVLEIEFKELWDNQWAWKITKQNEIILERNEFENPQLQVFSNGYPWFDKYMNRLFIRGDYEKNDDHIKHCTTEEKEKIEKKVRLINKKYGIKKRRKARKGEKYWFINSSFNVDYCIENSKNINKSRYNVGNCFSTIEEAEKYAEYMKKCSLEWHEKRDDNE